MEPNEEFLEAYDEVLSRWPVPVEQTDVPTPYGRTHAVVCGPAGAPPLVLLPGGGATAAVWFANASTLAATHRVYALDLPGQPGRSAADPDRPLRGTADLMAWSDAVCAGLGLVRPALCGHSYGAWIALHRALHAGAERLVLLDPTQVFAGFRPSYLLHALPTLVRPTPRRVTEFLRWETAGALLDPAWLRLQRLTAGFPAARPATGPRPDATALAGVPTLLVLAGRSRAHDTRKIALAAARNLSGAEVVVLPDATHHSMPHADAAELNRRIASFLR